MGRPRNPLQAAEIETMRERVEAYIDEQAAILKASADGRTLPIEDLRRMLLRHDPCGCRVALRLLAQK